MMKRRVSAEPATARVYHLLQKALVVLLLLVLPKAAAWTSTLPSAKRRSATAAAALARSVAQSPSTSSSSVAPAAFFTGGAAISKRLRPLSVSLSEETDVASSATFPELGDDGLYHILNREQHTAFLEANKDKLIVLKVYAPWCRACKGLEPKFLQISQNPAYADLPLVFCDLSIQHNKAFVKELGVLALPSVQFYVGTALTDNFPCGPSKVPILKRKLTQLVNSNIDPTTRMLKESSVAQLQQQTANETMADATEVAAGTAAAYDRVKEPPKEVVPPPAAPTLTAPATADIPAEKKEGTLETSAAPEVSESDKEAAVRQVPYFSDLSLADLDQVLAKAKVLQFEAGTILMREGKPGRTFYIVMDGEVEICQQTPIFGDPLLQPASQSSSYLGAVINRLGAGDYFGERALITGEPRAASIRAAERVTCLAFDKDSFPASCVLSGKTRNTYVTGKQFVDDVNDKYGLGLDELQQREVMQQVIDASTASQVRGSVNTPDVIRGVDTDEDIDDTLVDEIFASAAYAASATLSDTTAPGSAKTEDDVVSLLTRFQMIRQVSQCLNYIVTTRAQWGDPGSRKRRSLLVSRLTPAQRSQYTDAFTLIDKSGDGMISLMELKTSMEIIGETKTDDELMQALSQVGDGNKRLLNLEDFIGIMAESEFYNLFRDIFASLDPHDTGFVRAKDLDRVLCGLRDLISDDRNSIIDVEDMEMQIDYEQFSRMMLGTALI